MQSILRLRLIVMIGVGAVVGVSCSDDDGSDVVPKGPGMGGSSGSGMSGAGGGSQGGSSGSAGSGGMSGAGGSGGSAGGPPDCTPLDAGAPDAGDAGGGAPADGGLGDASTDGGVSGVVSFASDVHPIFVARCTPCHAPPTMSGGHNVADEDVDAAYADAVQFSASILERTNGGGMPPSYADPPNNCASGDGPGDPGCLTVEEYALLQTWVAQCYPR